MNDFQARRQHALEQLERLFPNFGIMLVLADGDNATVASNIDVESSKFIFSALAQEATEAYDTAH